jgi:hypothetical protein
MENLLRYSRELVADESSRLRNALISEIGEVEHALVVTKNIGQYEDIYTVLVPPDTVVYAEISRMEEEDPPVLRRIPYQKWRNLHQSSPLIRGLDRLMK